MAENMKLYYFPLRSRAEPARLLMEYNGVKYEDIRVSPEHWPSLKSKMPMGQLPVLDVGGKMLCQSTAITRYLAREFGLAGKNNWEQAKADMMVDGVFDMWGNLRNVYMALMQNDEHGMKENWTSFRIQHLKSFLAMYAKFLDDNKSGWLVGENITWADIVVSEFLSVLQDSFANDALSDHPKLKEYVERVQNLPQLKYYITNRPKTPF